MLAKVLKLKKIDLKLISGYKSNRQVYDYDRVVLRVCDLVYVIKKGRIPNPNSALNVLTSRSRLISEMYTLKRRAKLSHIILSYIRFEKARSSSSMLNQTQLSWNRLLSSERNFQTQLIRFW